jgi:hypothetical protein
MNLNFSIIKDIEIIYHNELWFRPKNNSDLIQTFSIRTETGDVYKYRYKINNCESYSNRKCIFSHDTDKNYESYKKLPQKTIPLGYYASRCSTGEHYDGYGIYLTAIRKIKYGFVPLNAICTDYEYQQDGNYTMKGIFLKFNINQEHKTKKLSKINHRELIHKKINSEIENINLIRQCRKKINIEIKEKAYQKLEFQLKKTLKMSDDIYKNVFQNFAPYLYEV